MTSITITDKPSDTVNTSDEQKTVYTEEPATTVLVADEVTAETTGEILSQIEIGMQKLIAQDDEVPSLVSKEGKDIINETSKNESSIPVEDLEPPDSIKQIDNDTPLVEEVIEKKEEIEESIVIPIINVKEPEVPDETVNIGKSNFEEQLICDKIDDVEETNTESNDKTGKLVEAFNDELLTSRNSLEIKFDEPVHSTPKTKIIPSLTMLDSSLEDIATGNSLADTPYLSSPSPSCEDNSSYQGSLSSPNMEKRYKDSENMHRKISGIL